MSASTWCARQRSSESRVSCLELARCDGAAAALDAEEGLEQHQLRFRVRLRLRGRYRRRLGWTPEEAAWRGARRRKPPGEELAGGSSRSRGGELAGGSSHNPSRQRRDERVSECGGGRRRRVGGAGRREDEPRRGGGGRREEELRRRRQLRLCQAAKPSAGRDFSSERVERTGEKEERDWGASLSFHIGVFSFSFSFYHLIQAF